MAAGTPVSFAASAFESSNTPASLSPGQHTDDDCTVGATGCLSWFVSQLEKAVEMGKSARISTWTASLPPGEDEC